MMKKTIGLLAAITLTLTSAGAALPASAEKTAAGASASVAAAANIDKARAKAESFAEENFDPEYGKYLKSLEAADEIAEAKKLDADNIISGAQGGSEVDKYTGNTYTHQDRFKNYDKIIGVDVSYFQYDIDWKKVKADGVDFAIIRLGYRGYGSAGTLVVDYKFKENLEQAKAAGLEVGIYFYTQAITTAEAVEEAEFCISNLKGYSIDLPVYFDIESVDYDVGRLDSANLTVAQKTAICKAFCDRMIKAGYKSGVYSNPYWLNNLLDASALEKLYPIWLANYTTYTSYAGLFDTWQYASTGYVNGISTNVDMNFDYRLPGSTPSDVSAYLSTSNTAVLQWTAVENAEKYEVYRYNQNSNSYIKVNTVVTPKVTVSATGAVTPYTVRSLRTVNGTKVYSDYSDFVYVSNKLISGLDAKADSKNVTLSWNELASADGYAVYRSENGGSFSRLAETDKASYTDSKVAAGVKYSYKVAPVFGTGDTDKAVKELIELMNS